MLNLPRDESDLSHRLPVIMITFDHIFLDFDHRCLTTLVSADIYRGKIQVEQWQALSHGTQRIFPSQLFTEYVQCPLICICKQP